MVISLYGSLADKQVQTKLALASQVPQQWSIYLVKENTALRSSAQNKLFHRILRKFAAQHGPSVQYWHDFLVEKYLGFDEVRTEDGDVRKVLCATSTLTVQEFTEFLHACLVFAAENQIH